MRTRFVCGVALLGALFLVCCREQQDGETYRIDSEAKHVQIIHLDGIRSDVLEEMLRAKQLPHFESLLGRGRISYDASTVDKSETMKIIQSYLTSRLDTQVVGWWQFNRADFRFRNYWLDPAEVLNYALGLEFPVYPTLQDLLKQRGENLVAGMSLARRSVPFPNYGRTYLEGATAVYDHTYYNQADATMRKFLDIHRRIGRSEEEKTPALSVLLLAAADEIVHFHGVTATGNVEEHCFRRDEEVDATLFHLLDDGGDFRRLEDRYFTRVDRSLTGKAQELCVTLPLIQVFNESSADQTTSIGTSSLKRAHPGVVLAMILIDVELGELIRTFKSIRFQSDGAEISLFDRTLFILFGDHGMVETRHMMTPPDAEAHPHRHLESLDLSFLDYLNDALALSSGADAESVPAYAELGIDYSSLPLRLSAPHQYADWQSQPIRELSKEATRWSKDFFDEIRVALRANLHEKYWWLFFLRSLLIDPELDSTIDPVSEKAVGLLSQLYLRGEPEYVAAEAVANREFFDQHVRLVYGGGARNNAELFFPSCRQTGEPKCSWSRRPTLTEILAYRGGSASRNTVIDTLKANPGVGIIFIREGNELFAVDAPLPSQLAVRVMDRFFNSGLITVTRDERSKELLYHYRVDEDSPRDPFGYGPLGRGTGTTGTYNEWNDLSVEAGDEHYYHNAVAGIGSYLYSSNPAIGDVLITHSQGWNFGDNSGGHGGIHREEKLTFMMVSGPDVAPGELLARSRYRTVGNTAIETYEDGTHSPTLLDVAPTALDWLGYPDGALSQFARDGFEPYLRKWVGSQRSDILNHVGGVEDIDQALTEAGFSEFQIEQFHGRLERLLQFVAPPRGDSPRLPDYTHTRTDGNVLILR